MAIGYIEDASFLLSLLRAFQGIRVSSHTGLIPVFNSVLQGTITGEGARALEEMISEERESAVTRSAVEAKLLRFKGTYHLSRAAAIRRS